MRSIQPIRLLSLALTAAALGACTASVDPEAPAALSNAREALDKEDPPASGGDPGSGGGDRGGDVDDEKPPVVPVEGCVAGSLEGGTTCIPLSADPKDPIADIRASVEAACAGLGLAVSDFAVDALSCGGTGGLVTYHCCPIEE